MAMATAHEPRSSLAGSSRMARVGKSWSGVEPRMSTDPALQSTEWESTTQVGVAVCCPCVCGDYDQLFVSRWHMMVSQHTSGSRPPLHDKAIQYLS